MLKALIRSFAFLMILIPFIGALLFIYRKLDLKPWHLQPPPPIQNFKWNHTGIITLWFDDAYLSQYNNAWLMKKYGFVGAMSVPTDFVDSNSHMSWRQLRTLQSQGWETISHSVTSNCNPQKYDSNFSTFELLESKKILLSEGLRADNFVPPCNMNARIAPILALTAKKYYRSYRVSKELINPIPVKYPYDLTSYSVIQNTTLAEVQQWITDATQQKGWLIIVFHHIDQKPWRYSITPDKFEAILKLVKQSNLPVVLPSQVLNIEQNQNNLVSTNLIKSLPVTPHAREHRSF